MRIRTLQIILFVSIILLASYFRLIGVNWDQGQHLHPDERFLTMVANGISWPKNLTEYLDTDKSPLNPHNRGYGFFVYGTFPVFFTKYVAESLGKGDYGNLTLIGRQLSAIFDLGTVILVFLITKEISSKFNPPAGGQKSNQFQNSKFKKKEVEIGTWNFGFNWKLVIGNWIFPYLAMFLYSIMVLPIQLSHFYAVDTYLVFFSTASVFFLFKLMLTDKSKPKYNLRVFLFSLLLAASFGLSLASKISGVLIAPTLAIGFFIYFLRTKKIIPVVLSVLTFLVFGFIVFRFSQPYAFASNEFFSLKLNPKFIQNMKELKGMDNSNAMYPPAIQWRNRTPYLFPINSLILHGLGPMLGIIAVSSFFYLLFITIPAITGNLIQYLKALRNKKPSEILIIDFILSILLLYTTTVFVYQGQLYTKNMRYFATIYPLLAITSGIFIIFSIKLIRKLKPLMKFGLVFSFFLILLIWPVAFSAIYQRLHSRVIASYWIYENIPQGSIISYEPWDDPLPLHLPYLIPDRYEFKELPMYNPDVYEKWLKVKESLQSLDYIIMSSNRLWGSITRVPNIYPIASKFYQALFDGSLGFELVADIRSVPCFPHAKLCMLKIDDTDAEESFTVYDHPQILIYKKKNLNDKLIDEYINSSNISL